MSSQKQEKEDKKNDIFGLPNKSIDFSNCQKFQKIPLKASHESQQTNQSLIEAILKHRNFCAAPRTRPFIFTPRFLDIRYQKAKPPQFTCYQIFNLETKPYHFKHQDQTAKKVYSFQLSGALVEENPNLSGNYLLRQVSDFNHLFSLQKQFLISVTSQNDTNKFLKHLETILIEGKNKKLLNYYRLFFPTVYSTLQGTYFIRFSTFSEMFDGHNYWSNFDLLKQHSEQKIFIQYFLKVCKVQHLIKLMKQSKKQSLQSEIAPKLKLNQKLFNILKKNDKDDIFLDHLQANNFLFLGHRKITYIPTSKYQPVKRQKLPKNPQLKQKTIIYDIEEQNCGEQVDENYIPQSISALSRTISNPVDENDKKEYQIFQQKHLKKCDLQLTKVNIE